MQSQHRLRRPTLSSRLSAAKRLFIGALAALFLSGALAVPVHAVALSFGKSSTHAMLSHHGNPASATVVLPAAQDRDQGAADAGSVDDSLLCCESSCAPSQGLPRGAIALALPVFAQARDSTILQTPSGIVPAPGPRPPQALL